MSDNSVMRHAPDSNNYHVPDQEQLLKMRGSRVGRFAIIPAAKRDGSSQGFDPTVAGPVHVDPQAADGGVIFDPSTVSAADMERAVASSYYPDQVYYQLGKYAKVAAQEQAEESVEQRNGVTIDRGVNPHLSPQTYVTPTTHIPTFVSSGGFNMNSRESKTMTPVLPATLPPLLANSSPQQPQPQQFLQQPPAQVPPPQYYAPQAYAPPPLDPNLAAMLHALVNVQQQVTALTTQRTQQELPPTTGMSSNPLPLKRQSPPLATVPVESRQERRVYQAYRGIEEERDSDPNDEVARPIRKRVVRDKNSQEIISTEEEPRQQTMRAYEDSQREPDAIITGFESLNLKFVTGPLANKAKRQVIFEIPNAGKHMARFHDVIVSKECVVLVYDTRYEEGQQYEPPELIDTPITLHVPHLKQSYTVRSMGFSYTFGVFDHIVLVKQDEEKLEYEDDK